MGHKDTLSPKVRAYEVDLAGLGILAGALGRDETFLKRAAAVRASGAPETTAFEEAGAYASGTPRRVVARLLLAAADCDLERRTARVVTRLANLGRKAVWGEAPLEPGDARRGLRHDREKTLELGAELVRRRGAGMCLKCGARLSGSRRVNTPAGGHARRDYCHPCQPKSPQWATVHREAIRAVLDATEAIVLGRAKRPQARRARRRSPHDVAVPPRVRQAAHSSQRARR